MFIQCRVTCVASRFFSDVQVHVVPNGTEKFENEIPLNSIGETLRWFDIRHAVWSGELGFNSYDCVCSCSRRRADSRY